MEEEDKGGVEVEEERKVMNRETTRPTRGWAPELQTDRQAGQRIKPRAAQGGPGKGSELSSLSAWVSSTEITHDMNHL